MSLVVGIQKDGKVYFGADSALCYEDYSLILGSKCQKIFKKKSEDGKEFLVGVTGSPRLYQLICHGEDFPSVGEMEDVQYIVNALVPFFQEIIEASNISPKKDEDNVIDSDIMIGFEGEIFKIQGDYQVSHILTPYMASGAGEAFALGTLRFIHQNLWNKKNVDWKRILKGAMDSASFYSNNVREPYVYLEL